MNEEEKKELNTYREIFQKLRPFIVLAINDYYKAGDKEELKQKYKDLGYELP